ncbi:hypothetical protein D9M71_646130 [compost metagenome]
MAFLFQAFGVLEHGPADVVADVGELVRFADLHDVEFPKWTNPANSEGAHAALDLAGCGAGDRLAAMNCSEIACALCPVN